MSGAGYRVGLATKDELSRGAQQRPPQV